MCELVLMHPIVSERRDASTVRAAVAKYARHIGCTPSNVQAAESVALATPPGRPILDAIRAGRERADALRFRQHQAYHHLPPTAA